ncbi:MAG: HAD family hydrolase [Calditrichales bacterium]|nr:MAG: HAD family hydrolase [Calditrichales bacterium]
MTRENMRTLLEKIQNLKIAVYGDFCLDAYWMMDPRKSEISVETGLQAQAVAKQSYSLGGASNVVANLAALNPLEIRIFGAVGNDIFGREMVDQLQKIKVDTRGLVAQENDFSTYVFCKRIFEGEEQPRDDFGIYNIRSLETDDQILDNLKRAIPEVDVVILNQQVPGSITNPGFIESLNEIIAAHPDKLFLLDSRHVPDKFRNVILKTNEREAARLNGVDVLLTDVLSLPDVVGFAQNLYKKNNKPVIVSRGDRGMIAVDQDGLHEIPGLQFLKKLDTVGAGDTAMSALACALAAGATTAEAIQFANFAAGVTVQKLFQTGTANASEIQKIAEDPDYIYQPELALDIRQATCFADSEIELCYPLDAIERGKVKHAVFDHDGTISALREGWEKVMEPVMIRAILGDHYETADETLYHKVVNRVKDFIDKSTGIQTVVQMQGLVEMVKEFGLVPPEQVLDNFGYKKIYNDGLMAMVSRRIKKLERGELEVSDYAVKGAIVFLQALRDRGVTLYLASGTDREDVENEARAMGYADLFNGGIYGAIGDIKKYSKKIVLNNIINENSLHGSELITLGDGPVELRECRKVGGIAIGIASDEIRRHGLNPEKRTRLIKAGAHIVVPDFSQYDTLLEIIFSGR